MLPRPPPVSDQPLALFLDFDGTLVEIAPRPDAVIVSDRLRVLLDSLHAALNGALAVISGRRLDDLLDHLAPLIVPACGSHGLEYQLRPGHRLTTSNVQLPASFWAEIEAFVTAHAGLLLEHKGHGAAVHYRQAPALQAEVKNKLVELRDRDAPGYALQAGKMVWELRPDGIHKGSAIGHLMDSPPFAGRLPVFVGDDLTDEDAFRAVNDLGGWAVHVGNGNPNTAATMGLPDVAAVTHWLQEIHAALSRRYA